MIVDEINGEAYHTDGYGKVYCSECEAPSIKTAAPKTYETKSDIVFEEIEEEKPSFWSRIFKR
jgi:hypothetical protein